MHYETGVENLDIYKKYITWWRNADPNSKFVYHIGQSTHDNIVGRYISQYLMQESIKGRVYLVTQKTGKCCYKFIAIKASPVPSARLVPFNFNVTL